MTNGKSKVPVNLDTYPALKALAETDKDQFLQLLKSLFVMANDAVASEHHITSKEYFGMPLTEVINGLVEAVFDYDGIIKHLPNQANASALSDLYKHQLNPLYAAFTKENMLDANGKSVSFEEKFGMKEKEFTVKDWIQGLLFYSYYCSLPDFARYLATNDYDLLEEEKHENIAKLIEIRPVLDYQKRVGILPGKLIPETGFFYAGDLNSDTCPACQVPDTLFDVTNELTICTNCNAGYKQ